MQETHEIDDEGKKEMESKCKGKLYRNNGTSSSRGVATLVRNIEGWEKHRVVGQDVTGRLLCLQIEIGGINWLFVNAYAPNDAKMRCDFFPNINSSIQNSSCKRVLFGGDFNNVLNPLLDRTHTDTQCDPKRDRSREVLGEVLRASGLIDSFRRVQPTGISYTFTGSAGYRARLDRLYSDAETAERITSVTTHAVPYSDHDLVVMVLGVGKKHDKWGNGRWILNKQLLFDQETQSEMRAVWENWREFKRDYKFNIGLVG